MQQQDDREALRLALWQMLDEADGHEALAAAIAEAKGWESRPRTWLSVLSHWTSADDPRDVPGWALAVAQRTLVPMGARDRIAPIQARAAYEAQEAAEAVPERPVLARVRPAKAGKGRAKA